LDSKQLSVEHILPESPTEEWALNFQGVDIDQYVYRIGNFTLLEANKNREADRKNFDEKKLIYQSSNYRLSTQTIPSEYWTPKYVLARQRELANQALAIWKINYQ
jgi:hypothetical protein